MKCNRPGCEGNIVEAENVKLVYRYHCNHCFKLWTWHEYRKLKAERMIEFVKKEMKPII